MPLPTGGWDLDANGFRLGLSIDSVDGAGNVSGTIREGSRIDQVRGFWDEDAQKIAFQRIIDPANPSSVQTYTGFLWRDSPPTSTDTTMALAGCFEAFSAGGGAARRSVFGWYAHIIIPG